MVQNRQLELGSVLAERYFIVKRIGGGGMGTVYMAQDKRLADAPRAIKELIGQFTDEKQRRSAIEKFELEAQLLASLEHSSIPTIYDYFSVNGHFYLVMKYIHGQNLEEHITAVKQGGMPEQTVVEWGIQLCDVLDYLHNQKPEPIIYRDMKPANIMLDDKLQRVMLVDFGIARFVSPQEKNVTAIGTMGYAPPELFAGKVEIRSDIYSLGATMFHLMTGTDPQLNPLLLFDFSRFPRPKQINDKLTTEIDQILVKSVEHSPSNRFASAADMKQVLEQHLRLLERRAPVSLTSMGAVLSLQLSPSNRVTFPLIKDTMLLGRIDPVRGITPDIDLSPYDLSGKISRRHALITWTGKEFLFEDLGSANGSRINGIAMAARQPQRLQVGDELRLGELLLRFSIASRSHPNSTYNNL